MPAKHKEIELPNTLGELFAVAIKDAKTSKGQGHYLDMGKWLLMNSSSDRCTLCLAGAVMLQHSTLPAPTDLEAISKVPHEWPTLTAHKLNAIDEMRNCNLLEAWSLLHNKDVEDDVDAYDKLNEVMDRIFSTTGLNLQGPDPLYSDADSWWNSMELIRDKLLEAGI